MKDTDYLSLSSRIRVLETKLLNRERRERMLEARSDDEAAKILTECGYAEPENLSVPAVNAVLSKARAELFLDLRKSVEAAVGSPALVEVFQIRYDYHNVKAVLKAEAMGEAPFRLLMAGGRFEPQALAEDIRKEELPEGQYPQTFRAAVREAESALAEHHDSQRSDLVLDRACYAEMTQAAAKSKSDFLQGYVRLSIDATNLRTAVRCARMGVAGDLKRASLLPDGNVTVPRLAETGGNGLAGLFAGTALETAAQQGAALLESEGQGLAEFERSCDNALAAYLLRARQIPFGEQPVVGYLCARESEATAIRTILSGRGAGLSADVIRERLRECYV